MSYLLRSFTSALRGLVPASGGGTTNFLRADGTWASGTVPAYRGALVYKNVAETAVNFTAATAVSFTTEDHDTDGFWVVGSPTIFTIPAGVSRVRVSAGVSIDNLTGNSYASASIRKNGTVFPGDGRTRYDNASTTNRINVSTSSVSVSAGDTFDIVLLVQTDTSIDIGATSTWFAIEVIE